MVLARVCPNGARYLGKCITDKDGDLCGRRAVNTMFSEHLQWHFPSAGLFHVKPVEFRLSGFKASLCELLSEKGNGGAPIHHS